MVIRESWAQSKVLSITYNCIFCLSYTSLPVNTHLDTCRTLCDDDSQDGIKKDEIKSNSSETLESMGRDAEEENSDNDHRIHKGDGGGGSLRSRGNLNDERNQHQWDQEKKKSPLTERDNCDNRRQEGRRELKDHQHSRKLRCTDSDDDGDSCLTSIRGSGSRSTLDNNCSSSPAITTSSSSTSIISSTTVSDTTDDNSNHRRKEEKSFPSPEEQQHLDISCSCHGAKQLSPCGCCQPNQSWMAHLQHELYLRSEIRRESLLRNSLSLPSGLPSFDDDNPSINNNVIICSVDSSDQEAGKRGSIASDSQTTPTSPPSKEEADTETCWSALKELMLAFILAGMGNIAASYWLGKVQSWSVFKNIPQLVILVPPLLGLKGNVEMTLASRLSTHANLGDLDTRSGKRKIIMGNMALIQCQASTVGFVAPLIALGLSLTSEHARLLYWKEIVLLVASSVITANVANLVLGSLMCGVILLSRRWGINPDNIATPIAASLGDVTTMILLANISHFLYVILDTNPWVQNTLLAFLMSLIPIWAWLARKNPFTKSVIVTGWYPVCGAMLIQNAGGLVMERALKTFHRIANLQLLING